MSSGIVYSAVARAGVILVSCQRVAGDFETTVNAFLPNVPVERNTKTCYQSGIYNYHILVEDLLIYICAAESDFGKNVPFSFLNEIKSKFTNGSLAIRALMASEHEFDRDFSYILKDQMIKYTTDAPADGVGKVKQQVQEVMSVMSDNINKVVDRGERLESLLDKTNELEVSVKDIGPRKQIPCPKYHHLISKQRSTSSVWQFFGLPADQNGKVIAFERCICKLCLSSLSAKGGSTSNMRSHLRIYHPAEHRNLLSGHRLDSTIVEETSDDETVNLQDNATQAPLLSTDNPSCSNNPIHKLNKQKVFSDHAPLDSKSNERCTASVTTFLATTLQPFSLVEEESFKKMFKTFNPQYNLPSRKMFFINSHP